MITASAVSSKNDPNDLDGLALGDEKNLKGYHTHDQIYVLFGIANDRHMDAIPIDYHKNVTQLFTEVAALCLQIDGNLDLLYAVPELGSPELPSWVPDWTITPSEYAGQEHALGPEPPLGELRPSPTVSEDVRVLTLNGFEVDTVIDIDFDYNSPAFLRQEVQEGIQWMVSNMPTATLQHLVDDTQDDAGAPRLGNLLSYVGDMLQQHKTGTPSHPGEEPMLREGVAESPGDLDEQDFELEQASAIWGSVLNDADGELGQSDQYFNLTSMTSNLTATAHQIHKRLFMTEGGMFGFGT